MESLIIIRPCITCDINVYIYHHLHTFCFQAGLVGNRQYDETISPLLIISITGLESGSLQRFPGGAEFNVTLPVSIYVDNIL